MTPFAVFKQIAQEGAQAIIHLRIRDELVSKSGIIRLISDSGILLETTEEVTFLSASSIENFSIPRAAGPTSNNLSPLMIDPPGQPGWESLDVRPAPEAAQPATESSEPVKAMSAPPEASAGPIDEQVFSLFLEPPTLTLPSTNFSLPDLEDADRSEIVRWKNRYEYALKVRDLSRLTSDVKPMERLAERLNRADLYLLAGLVALRANEPAMARYPLRNALFRGDPRAAIALAWLAKETNEPSTAFEMALRAATLDPAVFGGLEITIVLLGRMLAVLHDREFAGLADIVSTAVGTPAENLARKLLAFALQSNSSTAARAVLSGDLALAKQLGKGSLVFDRIAVLNAPEPPPGAKPSQAPAAAKAIAEEYGSITGAFPDRAYGFISNSVTGETLYFNFSALIEPELLAQVQKGLRGQFVSFFAAPPQRSQSHRYNQALSIRQSANVVLAHAAKGSQTAALSGRATRQPPLPPKGAGPYGEAKRFELSGDLEKAEECFKQEISRSGSYRQSAIKDLAMLLSRRNRMDEALQLLEAHWAEFQSKRPVDNLKATILVKAGGYAEAATIFASIHRSEGKGSRASISAARQAAYCFYMASDFTKALNYLEIARSGEPADQITENLIVRVREAQAAGRISPEDAKQLQALAESAASSGLSNFALYFVGLSEFAGADERSITRGFFEQRDFQQIDTQLATIRGRQPRMKGQLLQTQAAMCLNSPLEAGERSIQDLLRSCFLYMSEAAINDQLATDSVRCFLTEAAHLARQSSQATDVARFLLNTYLTESLTGLDLTDLSGPKRVPINQVVRLFEDDERGWQTLLADFPYYDAVAESAARLIEAEARRNTKLGRTMPSRRELDDQRTAELDRVQAELGSLRPLVDLPTTSAGLSEIARTLRSCAVGTRFKLDRERLNELARLALEGSSYRLEQDFIEKEALYGRIIGGLNRIAVSIGKEPTRLSIDTVLPTVNRLAAEIVEDFDRFKSAATASLSINNVLENDYYIPDADSVMTLALELKSFRGSAPVEGLTVTILCDGVPVGVDMCHSPELLRGGAQREIQVRIKPSAARLSEKAFTVEVRVQYHNRATGTIDDQTFHLPIAVGEPSDFEEIENPYSAYSGGAIVSDPKMLFGREGLLERIERDLVKSPAGQCFVLYGQKRSGKSSVLHRLKDILKPPHVPILLTIGPMDVAVAESSFVMLVIDAIEDWFVKDHRSKPPNRPNDQTITAGPSRALQVYLRTAISQLEKRGFGSPRIVLLVDEFTYLYEYIKEGIIKPTFMRQWKGYLELSLFSAVVVGQDSMPSFKQAFPNEFGVTHDERISYLSETDAYRLAEDPIAIPTGSRYRGRAVARLLELTAGSPFYLQIMCDHLVRHLNQRQRPFITEADVDQVARDLTEGVNSLPQERFDPLITAAGESVAEASRDTYFALLAQIANASRTNGGVSMEELGGADEQAQLLRDLRERDVLSLDAAGRFSIRVGLFADWLRVFG